ncbi:MAG: hypothetical protein ABI634_15240 [Acidobacteriota bacterium]
MAPRDEDVSAGSVLRELIFNQYQAIVLGGTAVASLVTLNPLPLLFWLGTELVLLPVLDSGPLRRLVQRKRREIARAQTAAVRARVIADLEPERRQRYVEMEEMCGLIEANYQGLTGISQAYLTEQRQKLDVILQGYLNRLMALQRYERMPVTRSRAQIEKEIAGLEKDLAEPDLPERAMAALQKNLELKRRLLASLAQVNGTVKTLMTELDSIESLLEVLHQNSISLRDPQAISEELDTIVRQSEDSERIVREMEALLRSDVDGWTEEMASGIGSLPASTTAPRGETSRSKAKAR